MFIKNTNFISTKNQIFCLQFLASTLISAILGYPQGLQSNLLASPYNLTNFEYGVFYGISCFPNIILPLFSGVYIDKYGYNKYIVFILEALMLFGSIIVTLGSYFISYEAMVIGQLLMGTGCENLQLLIKRFVLKISSKQESVKYWGLLLLAVRIGSLLSSFIPPLVYSWTESVFICFLVVSFTVVLLCFFFNISYYMSERMVAEEENVEIIIKESTMESENLLEMIKTFFAQTNLMFWLAIILVYSNFMMIYGFISEANELVMEAVNISALEASYFLVYYSVLSMIIQPLSGYFFGHIGYYIYALIIGVTLQIASSILFIEFFGTSQEYLMLLPLSLLAIGYCLGTTFIFSSLGFIVEKKYYGVAYGMLQCGIDFGGVFGSIIFGVIRDSTLLVMDGYFWPIVEITFFQIINLVIGFVVLFLDRKTLKILSKKKT